MTAKEFLKQYEDAERLARICKTEYEKELDLIDSIRSPLGGDGVPSSSGISKTTENKAIRLAGKAEALKEAETEALRIRQKVYNVISSIKGEAGSVLYEKYINLKSWGEVAEAVGYSKRHVQRIHDDALDLVKDVIECHS
ncbi:hypothetical protein [Ruminococcus sp.]|uniref:hypothetical protein n=1 Tax=Ruminococcus sp. TaxID=41978 RepID=UPI0038904CFE